MIGRLFKKTLAVTTSVLMASCVVSLQPFAAIFNDMSITANAIGDTVIDAYGQTVDDDTTWVDCTVYITGNGSVTFSKRITISGTVTINLAEGTELIAPKGIEVDEGNTLTIEGDGALNASVSDNFYSAIGRGFHGNTPGTSGTININGGNITATGGKFAAGIGGGDTGAGGTININGGTIVATGGYLAAGIGGGVYGAGGVINISGGQVTAISDDRASGIGPGYKGGISGTVTLGWTNEDDFIYATNYDNIEKLTLDDEFYFVDNGEHVIATTANIGGNTLYPLIDKNTLEYANIAGIEPFYRYTGNDIDITYTVTDLEGNLMEYGKDYTAEFSPSTIREKGDYTLTITAAGTNYTGSKSITFSVVDSITVTASTTEMNEKYGVPYRVSADATVDSRINIVGDILLILDEGKTLTASKGIELSKNNKLTIEGNGSLTANGEGNNAGIGALEVGTLIINSGNITATGGDEGSAGIGGSKTNYQGNTDGGFITINGGSVNATGSPYAAAIGGSLAGVCGTITINGGKVTANGGSHYVAGSYVAGYGIGTGYNGTKSGKVILGWTNEEDSIYFSSINDVEEIRFASGKNFFYAENNANVVAIIDNIENKTLHPYLEKVDFENVSIRGIKPYYPYTGNDIDIEYDVFDAGGNKLAINDDYTAELSRTPINDKGDYTLTVTAANGSNFTGSKSLTFHVVDYIPVTASITTMNSDYGLLYRVDNNATVEERITIIGDVTLVLDEGKTLTASKGIELSAGNKLTIEGRGILQASGEDSKAGIGARNVGMLVVNGNVVATGGNNAAGIGGSSNNTSGGTIIINGGEILAKGGFAAAGIGGGLVGVCGTITINGGKVIAMGGDNGDLIYSGIGSGEQLYARRSGTVTLGWTTEDDRILASNYNDVETLQFAEGKRFYIKNGENKIIATTENINGKTLIPLNGYFVDSASASVTVGDDSHKDIFNEKEYIIYKPGETVILNITPDDGYAVKSVKANNTEIFPVNGIYSFEMPAEDVTITAEFEESISDVSVTLKEDLGLNFIVGAANADNFNDYKIKLTGKCAEDGEELSLVSKTINGKTVYCVTASVSANNMGEEINAVLYKNNVFLDKRTYSVEKYLDAIESSTESTNELKALAEKAKVYGGISAAYFNGGTLPDVADNKSAILEETTFVPSFGTEKATISLVLNSKLAVRVYIKGLTEGATAQYGTEMLTAKEKKGRYYFEISNILHSQLNDQFTITYSNEDFTFTPMSWTYRVMNSETAGDEDLALANALYEFYQSIKAYNG